MLVRKKVKIGRGSKSEKKKGKESRELDTWKGGRVRIKSKEDKTR
jgi:hypothetical protein